MNEFDVDVLIDLASLAVLGATVISLAWWLSMQKQNLTMCPSAPGTRVPAHERKLFIRTVMEAATMARSGRLTEGYDRLLAGRRRVLTLDGADGEWVEEVVRWYQKALDNYVSRHGLG